MLKKIIFFIILAIITKPESALSQTFTNNSISLQGSWNTTLTKTINVSGLPNLLAGNFELVQVNLGMGRQADATRNFSKYSITITSPSGSVITLVNNPSSFPSALIREINTKFRDNSYLKLPANHGASAEPYHIGYYKSFDPFSIFNGQNPNGNWTITITENSVDTGARFNNLDLVFRAPYTVSDYTTINSYDSCTTPYCLGTSQIIVASNNGFTNQATDMYNPNTTGCSWNSAQNNSAWFKFRPINSNVKITISGISANLQILGLSSSGTNPCSSSNNSVVTGGCPTEIINDSYLSPQYSNGSTRNNQLNMSGLTVGQYYYFLVDGTGGAISPFYIEIEGASPDCSNCNLNAIVSSNSPVCSGQSLNLTCNDGTSWNWTGPNGFSSNQQNPIITNVTNLASGIYTVVITDINGCTDTKTINVTINSLLTPTFNNPNPICSGETLAPLPTISNNGITGTWSPSINNSVTTIYTFTPDNDQCATSTTLTITVNNCTFGTYASAVWIDDCINPGDGKFYNTTGTGVDLINQDGSVFTGTNYGVHTQNSNTLILRGAEVKTYKSNTTNVCSARLNYRVYLQTSTPIGFSTIDLPFYSNCDTTINQFFNGGGPCQTNDQKWQRVVANGITTPYSPVDLTNFPAGNYIIEVYYDVTGDNSANNQCDDTITLNNGGLNYSAFFTIKSQPTLVATNPTTCNGLNGFITISGLASNSTYFISYDYNTNSIPGNNYNTDSNGELVITNLNIGTYTNFNFIINSCSTISPAVITIVNPVFTPTFDDINPICYGQIINPLPITSLNGITGSWSPSLNNTQTTTYTFTPNSGQCALSSTLTISIIPQLQFSTSTQANTICQGSGSGCTPTGNHVVINEVRQYPITPQGIIGTGTEYVELYNPTCNPIDISCYMLGTASRPNANPGSTLATGGTIILPQGTIIAPKSHYVIGTSSSSTISTSVDFKTDLNSNNYCTTGNFVMPNGDGWISLYSNSGIPIDAIYWTVSSNQANKINTDDDLDDSPCTPNTVGGCSTTGITLLSAKDIYLSNSSLMNYVGISTPNPLSPTGKTFSRIPDGGNWQSEINPSIDGVNCNSTCDNFSPQTCNGTATITMQNTGNYTYLWNDNLAQTTATATGLCAGNYCVTVTNIDTNCSINTCVNVLDNIPNGTPSFSFGTTNTICSGANVPVLPNTSTNGIVGIWSPSIVSNTVSDTYTFTPNAGQCANTTSYIVTVNQNVTPTFTAIAPICSGDALTALPTTSNNGISGSWSPAIDNTTTTTYTFTPNAGQCATTTTQTIVVNQNVTPTFTAIAPICSGDALTALPTTSNNGISGSWSPAIDNTTTTTYTFTPNIGQCATTTIMNIIINPLPNFTINSGCSESEYIVNAISNESGISFNWYNSNNILISSGSSLIVNEDGDYKVIAILNGCINELNFNLNNVYCDIPRGISPNNDGLNDYFDLSNLNVDKIQIFNRYGVEVYSKENYTNQWDGKTNSGNELPDGTYYYLINFESGKMKTGWVYLMRQN